MDVQAQTHRCPQCSAAFRWDAAKRLMSCDHCGHTQAAAEPAAAGAAPGGEAGAAGAAGAAGEGPAEYDLMEALASQPKEKGLGADTRAAMCGECGASVSFAAGVAATHCAFCGSSQIAEKPSRADAYRPESVVPFQVDQTGATSRFKSWIGGLWFRPSDLSKQAKLTEMIGMYVPYWTFDAQIASRWTAEAGYHYYTGSGKNRTRHTRWEHASGARSDAYDDWLVCASKGLPGDLAKELLPFDTRKLKPYSPAFLAGWRAEEYQVELRDAWTRAQAELTEQQQRKCGRDVPGDTHRGLQVQNRFSGLTFKHILLPIFIAAYRYKQKPFRVLVNAQTGNVVGRAPWSWVKITLFVATILAALGGGAYLYQYLQ